MLRLLWASPCSLVGLVMAVIPLCLGGKARWNRGALEVVYREAGLRAESEWVRRRAAYVSGE